LACWVAEENDPIDPLDPPAGRFQALSVGESYACGIRVDGTLACWSNWADDLPTVPEGTFTGLDVPCAVRTTGELECLGYHEGAVPGEVHRPQHDQWLDRAAHFATTARWRAGAPAVRTTTAMSCRCGVRRARTPR
jgi:hypothetical protein